MSDITTKLPGSTVPGDRTREYRGWTLVLTGNNYYSACRGNRRVGIGAMYHGDRANLARRFRQKVDELEGASA